MVPQEEDPVPVEDITLESLDGVDVSVLMRSQSSRDETSKILAICDTIC